MKVYVLFFALLPITVLAQGPGRYIGKGLLSGKGTLAIGSPMAYGGTNMYVSGNLEYYLEENISFRGGLWFFLGTSGTEAGFAKNSTLFTGFYYHFLTNSSIDPYVGLEPGISITQLKRPDGPSSESYPYDVSDYPVSISPVASVSTGVNYYATNLVHLFVEAKYVYGTHTSDIAAVSLSEFRLAFGFGFNFWAKEKKG